MQARIRAEAGPEYESVAVLGCGRDRSDDARLIALAPEMAALLIDMDRWIRDCDGYVYNATVNESSSDLAVSIGESDMRRVGQLLARFDALGKDAA